MFVLNNEKKYEQEGSTLNVQRNLNHLVFNVIQQMVTSTLTKGKLSLSPRIF